MELSLENVVALNKGEAVTLEDVYGEFTLTQKTDSFLIEAIGGGVANSGLRLEIARPCGPPEAVLMAFEAFTEILANWPEV